MKSHGYIKRVGAPGVDDWQCMAAACKDRGPLRDLLGRTCKHDVRPDEAKRDLRDAVDVGLVRAGEAVTA